MSLDHRRSNEVKTPEICDIIHGGKRRRLREFTALADTQLELPLLGRNPEQNPAVIHEGGGQGGCLHPWGAGGGGLGLRLSPHVWASPESPFLTVERSGPLERLGLL